MPSIKDKQCTLCKVVLPLDAFGKRRDRPDGLTVRCRICKNKTSKASRQRTLKNDPQKRERDREACRKHYNTIRGREGARRRYLKRMHGITLKDYNTLFSNQNGCCAICGLHQCELNLPICIDHCHETGQIRGLLCDNCNKGIGFLQDNREFLHKAITYLEEQYVGQKAKNQ